MFVLILKKEKDHIRNNFQELNLKGMYHFNRNSKESHGSPKGSKADSLYKVKGSKGGTSGISRAVELLIGSILEIQSNFPLDN